MQGRAAMSFRLSTIMLAVGVMFMGSLAPAKADRIARDAIESAQGIVLDSGDRLSTPAKFQPPVEIDIVAKTNSTNLRLAYAADQVIFNWELDGDQLRIDGGPAAGRHKMGAGAIPVDQYIHIRWIVTRTKQSIFVDDALRYEHEGDYSRIDRQVSVFPAEGSKVTVRSIVVKPLENVGAIAGLSAEAWRRERPALPPAQDGAALAPTALYERLAPSVFTVVAIDQPTDGVVEAAAGPAGGSAVAISDHILLTNCHVVNGRPDLKLKQGDKRLSATLIYADSAADRCFLRAEGPPLHPAPGVRKFDDLHVGEPVYSLGSPAGFDLSFGQGLISGLRTIKGARIIQNSAPSAPGSSGGGLFDARGNLVGITTFIVAGPGAGANGVFGFSIAVEDFWR
jgi:hypothetical protein